MLCPCPHRRSKHDVRCVRQLLQLGADPAAGAAFGSALCALSRLAPGYCLHLMPAFLQRGLDPLTPRRAGGPESVLATCPGAAPPLLAHLEQQRAAGSLQLGSVQRAAQLLIGVARFEEAECHLPLARHGIAALERLLGLAGNAGAAGGGAAAAANAGVLQALLKDVVAAGQPAVLEPLLASRLPLNLAAEPERPSLLVTAAIGSQPAACVRLLRQAGAPAPVAADLYCAIDCYLAHNRAHGVFALLACGAPAVDVSAPAAQYRSRSSWSCPILRTLHALLEVRGGMRACRLGLVGLGACTELRCALPHPPPRTAAGPPSWAVCGRRVVDGARAGGAVGGGLPPRRLPQRAPARLPRPLPHRARAC